MDRIERKYILARAGYGHLGELSRDMGMSYNWLLQALKKGMTLLQALKLIELTGGAFIPEDLLTKEDLKTLQEFRSARSKETI